MLRFISNAAQYIKFLIFNVTVTCLKFKGIKIIYYEFEFNDEMKKTKLTKTVR